MGLTEIIFLGIFLIGVVGMGVIVFRKIPALKELPLEVEQGIPFSRKMENLIINNSLVFSIKSFSFEKFLHITLSKVRIISMKIESLAGFWLNKIRQKNIEKKNNFKEGYWEKIKKDKENKNSPK